MVDRKSDGFQRLEVITGVGRRRRWPVDFKAAVVAESQEAGTVVSEVARRHGLRPQQLFAWRNETRRAGINIAAGASAPFAPVMVTPADPLGTALAEPPKIRAAPDLIEIAINGAIVRIRAAIDAKTLAVVLRAVKAAR